MVLDRPRSTISYTKQLLLGFSRGSSHVQETKLPQNEEDSAWELVKPLCLVGRLVDRGGPSPSILRAFPVRILCITSGHHRTGTPGPDRVTWCVWSEADAC